MSDSASVEHVQNPGQIVFQLPRQESPRCYVDLFSLGDKAHLMEKVAVISE